MDHQARQKADVHSIIIALLEACRSMSRNLDSDALPHLLDKAREVTLLMRYEDTPFIDNDKQK